MHTPIVQTFKKNYRPNPGKNVLRKIGIELELPIVRNNGEAIDYQTTRDMFAWLAKRGWELSKDEGTGENVEAQKSLSSSTGRFGYEKDVIGTDVGYCTVETSLSPEDDLFALEKHWGRIRDVLLEFFGPRECHILGYGVQPMSHPARTLVANKGRYAFFIQDSLNRFIDQKYGEDLNVFATTASNQCHIDVYEDEAITAVNVFNGLAPLLTALTANAPVWRGSVDPEWVDIREIFWDKCWTNRINQVGIPDKFKDFSDYVDRLCQFRAFMVKRDGQYIRIQDCETFGDYLDRAKNTGQTVSDKVISLQSSPEDIHFQGGIAWWQARLASSYGTLEVRPCGQQPPDATMAIAAISLGLVENLGEAEKLYNKLSLADWRKLRFDALRHGMQAHTSQGESIMPLVKEALAIARKGLQKRGLGEEIFLDVLDKRAASGRTVADQVKEVFDAKNLQKFFDLVEIK